MSHLKTKIAATLVLLVLGTGAVAPMAAYASENGRRNTTYALGALTGLLLYKHQWLPAAAAGVGTYYAYHNWQALTNARHRHENALRYRHAYRLGYATARRRSHRVVHRTYHRVRHHRR